MSTFAQEVIDDIASELDIDIQTIPEAPVPERVKDRESRNGQLHKVLQKYKPILVFPEKNFVSSEVIQPFIISQPKKLFEPEELTAS